jgi:predicted nucleic acid-binding protein
VFGDAAASHFAAIAAARESARRPISAFDAMIAAMCRVAGASLATRNVAAFDVTGVDVMNPWQAGD